MSTCRNIRFIASAGTGKTHQVVSLYQALLFGRPYPADDTALPGFKAGSIFDGQAPIPPERILMLTFTRNAAAEMRTRVTEAVERELASGNPDTEAFCWSLLRRLPAAVISTIHSFSQQLLASHTLHLGLSPNLTILEETEAEDLRTDMIEAALKAGLTGPAAKELENLCDGRRVEGIEDGIVRTLRLAAAWGVDLEKAEPADLVVQPVPPGPSDLDALLKQIESASWQKSKKLHDVLEALRDSTRRIHSVVTGVPPVQATKDAAGDGGYCSNLVAGEAVKIRQASKGNWGQSEDIKALKSEVEATLDSLASYPDRVQARQLLITFLTVVRDSALRIRARKRAQGVLDFDDLLFRARELLETRPEAVPELDVIIVDEAQDNSRIQNDLIRLVQSVSKAAMVMCGDTKQTIYGWRGADAEGLPRFAADMKLDAVPLTTSYRSQKGIVDWVNDIFAGVVFDTVQYGDNETLAPCPRAQPLEGPSVELLVPDWEWGPKPSDAIAVGKKQELKPRLTLTPRDVRGLAESAAGDFQSAAALTDQAIALEARAIARRIRLLTTPRCGSRWHPPHVWDPSKETWIKSPEQPYRFRDILILLRASGRQELYEQALQEEGIPFTTDGKGRGFFTRQETLDISNLLSWLAFPNDSLALLGVLRSPFIALSDNAIAAIGQALRKYPEQGLSALNCELDDPADAAAQHRAQHVFGVLRKLSGRVSAVELVRETIRLTGYDAILAGTFHGVQRLANLQKLLSWIQARERDETLNLQEMARRLADEISGGRETPDAAVLDPDDDSVRINTVHAAKGLSSPVVILPDLRRIPTADRDWILVERDTDGTARSVTGKIKAYDGDECGELEGEGYAGAYERNKLERDQESRRLFYVACTRARDLLILSGENPANGSKDAWRSWVNRQVIQCDYKDNLIRLHPYSDVEKAWRKIAVAAPPLAPPPAECFMIPPVAGTPVRVERYRFPVTALAHPAPIHPSPQPIPSRGEGEFKTRLTLAPVSVGPADREDDQEGPEPVTNKAGLGTLAHRILESLDYRAALPLTAQIDQSPEWLETTAAERNRLRPQVEAAAQALTSLLNGVAPDDLIRELPFAARFTHGGAELIADGKADLLFFKAGAWHVVDYKFSDHDAATLRADYALQLAVYREALSTAVPGSEHRTPRFSTPRNTPAPFKLILLGISRSGQCVEVDVTDTESTGVATRLIANAKALAG